MSFKVQKNLGGQRLTLIVFENQRITVVDRAFSSKYRLSQKLVILAKFGFSRKEHFGTLSFSQADYLQRSRFRL